MPSKIKTREDLVKELCDTGEKFDSERLMREKDLAKILRRAIE